MALTAGAAASGQPVTVFTSYAHADEFYRDELEKHLSPLKRAGLVGVWHDRRILPGADWDAAIEAELRRAHVIVLLISADFLNSDHVNNKELPIALQRRQAGDAVVIPVIVRSCLFKITPLGTILPTPRDGRPVATFDRIDDAMTEVAQMIYDAVRQLLDRAVTAAAPHSLGDLATRLGDVWNVPYPQDRFFTGREDVIAAVDAALAAGRPVALTGPGGVGKSAVATDYAYRHRADYRVVWWQRAETRQTLTADVAALARALALPEADQPDLGAVIAAVQQWLAVNGSWLLIFDNAHDADTVGAVLPAAGRGHVILTSRQPAWPDTIAAVPLGAWRREDSIAYLLARTGESDRAAAGLVAARLRDLPLALAQAAAQLERGRAA